MRIVKSPLACQSWAGVQRVCNVLRAQIRHNKY